MQVILDNVYSQYGLIKGEYCGRDYWIDLGRTFSMPWPNSIVNSEGVSGVDYAGMNVNWRVLNTLYSLRDRNNCTIEEGF